MGLDTFFCIALTASLVSCGMDMAGMVDFPVPLSPSSPGWSVTPQDVAVELGGYGTFRCHTLLLHTYIYWTHNGKTVMFAGNSKFLLSDSNRTLTYGPVETGDEATIGCVVDTPYGLLPSQVGKVSIKSLPLYKPEKVQVAQLGKPFDFDFGYSSPNQPSSFSWTKNGLPFRNSDHRVCVDHTGIIFTRVLHSDAGTYVVTAKNTAGTTSASAVLEVLTSMEDGSGYVSSLTFNPKMSFKLAISLAIEQTYSNSSVFYAARNPTNLASTYSQKVMSLLKKVKKPSSVSKLGGKTRVKIEQVLVALLKLLHRHGQKKRLSDSDMTVLENNFNCSAQTAIPNCSVLDFYFRSIDGTCNNFFFPLRGAAGSPLVRLLPANYEDGISAPLGLQQLLDGRSFRPPWPSARYVSWKIVKNLPETTSLGITHMVMQWGQFIDHDLDISPLFEDETCDCSPTLMCIPIEVSPDDDVFGMKSSNNAKCLTFSRSVPVCTTFGKKHVPRNQVNDVTSYLDASQIYGYTKEIANELRLFKGGLLKQGGRLESLKGNLPVLDTPGHTGVPFFVAGDSRVNEQVGLTIMHTVWLREHNRITRELMTINPCWNDERLYQETRKIVGAMVQIITFKEFLPVLFGPYLSTYVSEYRGYNAFIDATIPNSFSTAAYRFGHSLIRDRLDRLDKNYHRLSIGPLPLHRAFNNPSSYFESFGTDPILRGLVTSQPNAVDEFMNTVLTSQLFLEEGDDLGMDLASLNIQRGRDHGLPTYRQLEKFCSRLYPQIKASFMQNDTEEILRTVYGDDGFRRGIDLWVGGLLEKRLPGAHLGPTFACILGITFARLRDGDRFWYQNSYIFTLQQRRELQKTSLAKVVCTNADDISKIQHSVLLGGQPKLECSSIPSPSLVRWKDSRCSNQKQFYG